MKALLVLLPAMLALASGCDEEPTDGSSRSPGSDVAEVTRADGSTLELTDIAVECQPSEYDEEVQVIRAMSPYVAEEGQEPEPFFLFFAPLDAVAEGKEYRLPLSGTSDVEEVTLFVLDDPNELSGAEKDSSGRVTVVEAACEPEPRLVLEVEATLGSELSDQEPADVKASLDLE